MLRLHKCHFLPQFVTHYACQQVWVGQPHLLSLGDCFFVDYIFYRDIFEELVATLVFGCRLNVILLKGVLFRKLLGFCVLLVFLMLFFPVVFLCHHVFFMFFRVPGAVRVDHSRFRDLPLFSFVHFFATKRIDDSWNLHGGRLLNHF